MKRDRENLYKIKGGHEQKSLGSRDVNDIPNSVSCNPRLFAVGTCFLVSSPSLTVLENECNKKNNKLQIWFSANELQINPEKFAIIVIPSKLTAQTTNLSIFHNERPIKCFEFSKYLGVNLDNKFNFKSHICIIAKTKWPDLSVFKASFITYFLLLHYFWYSILLLTLIFYLVSHCGETPTNLTSIDNSVCKAKQYDLLLTPS